MSPIESRINVNDSVERHFYPTSFSVAKKMRSALIPGSRIICNNMCPILAQEEGVIIDAPELLDGHDCVVKLDNYNKPFGFYWNEVWVNEFLQRGSP